MERTPQQLPEPAVSRLVRGRSTRRGFLGRVATVVLGPTLISGLAALSEPGTANAAACDVVAPATLQPSVDACVDTYLAHGRIFRVYQDLASGRFINGVPDAAIKVEVLENIGSSQVPDLTRRGSDRFFDRAVGRERRVVEAHLFTAPGQTNGILYQEGTGADILQLSREALTDCDTFRSLNVATNREDDNAVAWVVISRMNEKRTAIFNNPTDHQPESYLGKLYWFKASHLQAGVPISVAELGSISKITEARRLELGVDYSKGVFIPKGGQPVRVI